MKRTADEPTVITVCQSAPRCSLEGVAALAAQNAGCIWCDRITTWPDGTETKTGPSTQ